MTTPRHHPIFETDHEGGLRFAGTHGFERALLSWPNLTRDERVFVAGIMLLTMQAALEGRPPADAERMPVHLQPEELAAVLDKGWVRRRWLISLDVWRRRS